MAHIGNSDQQTPALSTSDLGRFAIHGVVKITCVFTVDGDKGNVGEVNAAFFILCAHGVRQRAGQGHRGVAEFMRHTVFAHCDFNFHARVVNFTQHFHHAAYRLSKQSRRLGQLNHDDLTRLG